MKLLYMTSVGNAISSSPSDNNSLPMRILIWLRRHGGQGSDVQIKESLEIDGIQLKMATNTLLKNNAIRVVGG